MLKDTVIISIAVVLTFLGAVFVHASAATKDTHASVVIEIAK